MPLRKQGAAKESQPAPNRELYPKMFLFNLFEMDGFAHLLARGFGLQYQAVVVALYFGSSIAFFRRVCWILLYRASWAAVRLSLGFPGSLDFDFRRCPR